MTAAAAAAAAATGRRIDGRLYYKVADAHLTCLTKRLMAHTALHAGGLVADEGIDEGGAERSRCHPCTFLTDPRAGLAPHLQSRLTPNPKRCLGSFAESGITNG
ncbi:hypothetical protein ColLi_13920 [Colletotrichum liriopes]|uniref:Uncharacterized protein n=1 Tax=Colletotrichum liriopes TaxID=708192 RepID=A0AA37H386_9PEZI|nr:hypothetical protein ColLi_13920 [Colletotrichum liriopes]